MHSILKDNFLNITIGDWLARVANMYPDNDAVINVARGVRLNYRELDNKAREVAKALLKMGVKKGDHVAIWATNYPEWLYLLFGSAKIGAILVTVNTNYKIFELEYLLRQSDSMSLFFIDGMKETNYVEIIKSLLPGIGTKGHTTDLNYEKLPFLKNIVFIPKDSQAEVPKGFTRWDDILKSGVDVSDDELDSVSQSLDCHEVINMQYTSGTTGFPKGVMLTHHNILNNGYYIGRRMNFSPQDRLCITVPLFHCFGLVLATLASLTHASAMVLVDYFRPAEVLASIEAERCTAVHGVPTMFIFMLEFPEFDKYDLSSLRTGIMAGSPCPINVMREVVSKMGMKEITITYGQTEASPATTMTDTTDPLEIRVSTVGRAMPFVETKIIDPETGKELPDNHTGEFCSRGYNTMRGYYKMEEATRAVLDDKGWLHSGDLAVRDEQGYYKITGRIKDMIIRGGENIYPREIEELIYTHPKVQDVQVIGIPSEKFGEEVMAYIITKKGEVATEDEIKEFVRTNMSRHKVPSHVHFIDEFPMTASGKIQKYKLREMAGEELKLDQQTV